LRNFIRTAQIATTDAPTDKRT